MTTLEKASMVMVMVADIALSCMLVIGSIWAIVWLVENTTAMLTSGKKKLVEVAG